MISNSHTGAAQAPGLLGTDRGSNRDAAARFLLIMGVIVVPCLYLTGSMSIVQVNMLGRYLCFAIVAVSLDLLWGYTGLLCLCQSLFFALGGYAMGMYLAHHGGPEGVIDASGWKLPACLHVVYPAAVWETEEYWQLPFFWKPFYWFESATVLGLLVPGLVALVVGFFIFRSRVRGVFFAILTQALTLAAWLVFCMNDMKFCGTNGLTRFEGVGPFFTPQPGGGMPKLVVALTIVIGVNLLLLISAVVKHFRAQARSAGWRDPWRWGPILASLLLGLLAALWIRDYVVADHALLATGISPKLDQLKDDGVKFVLYLMTVVALVDVFLLCKYIVNSRLGRVLVAVRDKESRLRFSGYQPYVYKVFIFSISAMIAGLGGMLYAPQMGIFTPTNMEPKESILVVIWVAVGGRATLVGPIIGALSVNLIYNYLTGSVPETWPFLLGGLFVAIVLFRPDGLISLKQDTHRFRRAISRFRDYRGRSGRQEFWYFVVFSLLVVLLLTAGTMLVDPGGFSKVFDFSAIFSSEQDVLLLTRISRITIWVFLGLAAIPAAALAMRRLHDAGRSAWWMLLTVAPVLTWGLCSWIECDLFAAVETLYSILLLEHFRLSPLKLIELLAALGICLLLIAVALYVVCRYFNSSHGGKAAGGHQLSWYPALVVAAAICAAQVTVPLVAQAAASQLAHFADGDLVLSETQTLVTWLDARMGDGDHHRLIVFIYLLTVIFLSFLATANVIRFFLKTTFGRANQVALLTYGACTAVVVLLGLMDLSYLLAGVVLLLVLMSIKGNSESNQYGEVPAAAVPESAERDAELQDQESEHVVSLNMAERLQRVSNIQRLQTDKSQIQAEIVSVHDLTVVFDGFKALDIDHFAVPHYMLQVIIGPNGAGKTTLCDVISGKTRPTTGRVLFNGEDITEASEADIARLGVGRKFQTPTVYDSLSVYQNMELALPDCQGLAHNLFRMTTSAQRDHIHQMLERVRLDDDMDRQVQFLSHGQRQWLEISMLILSDPKLLLVDEPAAGLTDEETVLTAELLLELQEDHSIIVIEHDMEFVRMLSAPVMVLNEGLIMASGTMEEVQADERVVEAYLGR